MRDLDIEILERLEINIHQVLVIDKLNDRNTLISNWGFRCNPTSFENNVNHF